MIRKDLFKTFPGRSTYTCTLRRNILFAISAKMTRICTAALKKPVNLTDFSKLNLFVQLIPN